MKFWIGVFALVLCAGLLVWGSGQGWFDGEREQASIPEPESTVVAKPLSRDEAKSELAGLLGVKEDGFSTIGGVERPTRDISFDPANPKTNRSRKSILPNPGRAPFLKGNENSQVAGLMAELGNQDKEAADDLRVAKSTFFQPEPFNQEKYEADPQAHLEQIRPGRIFQSAQPDPDVKRLTAISEPFISLMQGDAAQLKVQAEPGAPVVFHTQETGTFENQLKTITVAADEDGVATAKFTLGRGTSGLVNVLAAFPILADQVAFTFRVSLPAQQ